MLLQVCTVQPCFNGFCSPRCSLAWSGRFTASTAAGSSSSTQVEWISVRVGGENEHQLKTYKTVFHFLLWG